MKVALKVLTQFRQGPKDEDVFVPGDAARGYVPDETWQKWSGETLAARLENKFVVWEPRKDSDDDADASPEDIASMDRSELLEHAERVYGEKMDKRLNITNILQRIAVLQERAAAKAQADAIAEAKRVQDEADFNAELAHEAAVNAAKASETGTGTGNDAPPAP